MSSNVAVPSGTRHAGAIASIVALFLLCCAGTVSAQLTGTRNVPGDYADLAAALTDLNAQGVGAGGVTINVVAANPQSATAGGYVINLAAANASAANPVSIRGNGNTVTASAAHTAGALTDAVFKVIGEDFVTIDGFSMLENPLNTVTAAATNNMTEFGVALFYRTATDGAQNASILGNTIALNRSYQNTFGIYSNSTHTATAVATTANATGATGGNNGLVVRGNTISNVNIGIVVVGAQGVTPGTAADHNEGLDIGGASLATGNTISNYGTTNVFSSYANVSGTVNGILVRNTRNFNISFNTITSSVGGTTAGTLRGIFVPTFSAAPTGALTGTINGNRISVRTGVLGGTLAGIIVETGTLNPTSSITVNNNTFADSGYNVAAASGVSTFLSVSGSATAGPLNTTINGNSFDNLSIASSGSLTLISNSFARPANGTITVNGNAIASGLAKTLAGGTVTGYINNSTSLNTVTEANSNNNFSNITLSGVGATTFIGWQSSDGGTPGSRKTVTNNTINNVSNATTGANTGLIVSFSDNTFAGNEVSGNTVSNISSTSATAVAAVIGISSTSGNQNLSNNTVHTLSAAGSNTVSGISIGGGTTQNVSRNRIYNLSNSNAAGLVNGIVASAGTTVNVFNNIVGDLRAPAANAANPVVGINITGATTVNADYNSVFLNATSVGVLFGSSALSASTTPSVTLRNNNLVNGSTANGAGISAAYRRSSATLTTYGAASNGNNLFGAALYTDGTSTDTTVAAFRLRMSPRDAASVTEGPAFISTDGANANFLNISTVAPTRLESGATSIAGIATDFAGLPRNATTPDIGAWEFAGVLLDEVPPSIGYTPLSNTTLLTNRVVAATISDASGVASGANAPRTYFRKGAGAYVSTACAGTAPAFSCSIDYSLVGGVVTGDVISYFVIAQDTLGNIAAVPGAGLVAGDVNTVTTPPTTPSAYTIVTPFAASVNVGAAETITSLTNAGGLFAAANAGVFTGDVVINITSDLTAETGAVALNQRAEEGAGNYRFTIIPQGAARVISGTFNGPLVRLNGSSRVTVDGSIGGIGTDRSLTIQNTSTTTPSVVLIGSVGSTPITNVTLKNAIVINGATTSSAVVISDASVAGTAGLFSNIVIQNNDVQRAFIGVFATGGTTPQGGSNLVYTQNTLNASGANAIRLVGLYMQGVNGATVSQNALGNFSASEGENDTGIWLATGTANATVSGNTVSTLGMTLTTGFAPFGLRESSGVAASGNSITGNTISALSTTGGAAVRGIAVGGGGVTVQGNRISDIKNNNTGTFGAFGIDVTAGNGSVIQNNFVSDVNHNMSGGGAFGPDFGVVGIRLGAGTGHRVYFNSVNLFGPHTGTPNTSLLSAAFSISTTAQTGIDVRNNIFANNITGGTTSIAHVAVFLPSGGTSAMNLTWNNNAY